MPSPQQPALRSATTTILFDVVVRDGKGMPVRDMAATEFELSEDGSRQTITAIFGPGGRPQDFATRQRLLNGAGPERLLYAMEMRMAETYERYTRDVQG